MLEQKIKWYTPTEKEVPKDCVAYIDERNENGLTGKRYQTNIVWVGEGQFQHVPDGKGSMYGKLEDIIAWRNILQIPSELETIKEVFTVFFNSEEHDDFVKSTVATSKDINELVNIWDYQLADRLYNKNHDTNDFFVVSIVGTIHEITIPLRGSFQLVKNKNDLLLLVNQWIKTVREGN